MDVPVTHYHTCHTQSCLSNIIVNVILVPLLATVLWLWPLIAAVPGSKAMNRRRKLGLSALLRPLPYPLVPSFDAGWSQCDQIWKQPVMSKYPVFVSLLSFWDTILLCGWFFFWQNTRVFSPRFPGQLKRTTVIWVCQDELPAVVCGILSEEKRWLWKEDLRIHIACCYCCWWCQEGVPRCCIFLLPSSQAGLRADGAGESTLPAEEASSAGSANSENSTR